MNYWNGESVDGSYDFHIEYWAEVGKDLRGVWSVWGPDLRANSKHPLGENAYIKYASFWDDDVSYVKVEGDTVLAVYAASSKALTEVNEGDHSFIEAFTKNDDPRYDNVWELYTGS